MKIGHTIDADGYFTGDVLEGSGITPNVTTICPDGFYRPRWDGSQWVEGGSAPDPGPHIPTAEERIAQLEADKADQMQRTADIELALADLFTS